MARGRKGLGVELLTESIRLKFTLATGERVSETLPWLPTPANQKKAQKLAVDIRRDIQAGALDDERYLQYFPDTKRMSRTGGTLARTLADFSSLYLTSCGKKSANTKAQFRIQIDFWLKLLGGGREMSSFRHSELKAKIGGYAWKSWRHHNNYLVPLRGTFALWTADDPRARSNPLDGIKNMKQVKGEEKVDKSDAFTEAEEKALLQEISWRYEQQVANYFDFAFATGLRPEEQIELKWADIDLETAHPVARITRARSLGEVRPPKNHERRSVELSERAVEVLRRQRAYTRNRSDGYVFVNPATDAPWHDTRAQRDRWNRVMKDLGLRHRTPYSTRHTQASRMLMAGCNAAWCAAQLGHSKEMFFRIYADWIDADRPGAELAKMKSPFRPEIVHASVGGRKT